MHACAKLSLFAERKCSGSWNKCHTRILRDPHGPNLYWAILPLISGPQQGQDAFLLLMNARICSQPKSRDFPNWNPGIFCCYVLDPLERSLALRHFFSLHIFSPYSLMERGQHTKTNINRLSSQASSLRRHLKTHTVEQSQKMTGGTPEVRSDKSLTLLTLNIWHSTYGPMDQ